MAKKNAKHGKSNQTKPQSSKMSVTMEGEKTSETAVEETDIGRKKLIRHQEKIKREEEELKRIQAEKQKKEEAAERSKKASKNKAPKSKNKELPVTNMTENIPVIKNKENVGQTLEKPLEKPIETPIECMTPTIETLYVKPGSAQGWTEQSPYMREDWNDIIKNEEERTADDEKMQQTGSGNLETDGNETEYPHGGYQNEVNSPSYNDRGFSYQGSERRGNQNQRSFVRAEFRRGGGGGNYYNENSRRGSDFSNRGENSNHSNRYNKPRHSNDSQNSEGNSNARPSSRAYQDETENSERISRQQPYHRAPRNYSRTSNESGNVDRHSKSFNHSENKQDYSSTEKKCNDGGTTYAPRHQNDNRGNRNEFRRNPNQANSNYPSRSTYHNRDRKNTDQADCPPRYQNRRGTYKNNRGNYNSHPSYGDSKHAENCGISTWGEPEQHTTHETSEENCDNECSSNVTQSDMNPKAAEFKKLNTSDPPSEDVPETTDTSTYEVDTSLSQSHDSRQTPMSRNRHDQMKTDQSYRNSDDDIQSPRRNYSSRNTTNDRWPASKSSMNRSYDSKTNSLERRRGDKRPSTGSYMWNHDKGDKEFEYFLDCNNFVICHGKLREVIGDLFEAPNTFSLAHCVAADLSMGAGIAVHFRSKFGRVGYLLSQEQKVGGLAVLQDDKRFIYYLITKERSHGKPTYFTLWKSLQKLKDHCVEHGVRNLAIPQIGCGLDRLDWYTVKQLIEHVFRDVDIEIVVYSLEDLDPSPRKPKKGFVTHTKLLLKDIDPLTGLLYLGVEDAGKTIEMESLNEKHNFIHAYKSAQKKTGDVIRTIVGKEYIYGLIARKTLTDKFDFIVLEKALRELRKMVRNDKTTYIAFQAFQYKDSTLIVDQILSLMQYILNDTEIWVCWPPALEQLCPPAK